MREKIQRNVEKRHQKTRDNTAHERYPPESQAESQSYGQNGLPQVQTEATASGGEMDRSRHPPTTITTCLEPVQHLFLKEHINIIYPK